jgi:VWFA-related protein
MKMRARLAALALAGVTVGVPWSLAQEPDITPRFETDVDVVAVDASVVDGDGRPVRGLTAADFQVEVDGRRRRVLSADFIEFRLAMPSADPLPSPPSPVPAAIPQPRREGRRVVIVLDRGELGIGAVRAAARAASGLLDQLGPEDRVALFSLPSGPRVDFTTDRAAIETALGKIGPALDRRMWEFNLSLAEAVSLVEGRMREANPATGVNAVVDRECRPFIKMVSEGTSPNAMAMCVQRVEFEARLQVEDHMRSLDDRMSALEALCQALRVVPGAKTLVLVSGGLGSDVFRSGRSLSQRYKRIAAAAAASSVNLYTLYFSQRASDFSAEHSAAFESLNEDRDLRLAGLERLTGLAGGAMLEVVAGADHAFRRVASEISGHYLLGLEPDQDDRDGKPHDIEVKVARKGVLVRARRQFVMNPEARIARRARAQAPAAPPSPVSMTPHVMRGASEGQIKVVLAAEVEGFSGGTLAVQVVNPAGAVVGTLSEALHKPEDAPARWQETLLLARGPYVMKAEAVDASGRRVTAERPLNAELLHGVGFDASDLMLFERVGETSRLVAGSAVRGRVMPVYLELYVDEVLPADRLGVQIEIVGADGTRRGSAPLALRKGEEPGLHFAEGQVDVWALPPGKYVARALVTFGTKVARRVERHFEVIR